MASIVRPPYPVDLKNKTSVFLAGTIDNGDSVDWQSEVEQSLSAFNVIIMNPRRDKWKDEWIQSINNAQFKTQVEWELRGLEISTIIFLYFAANSKSPISLLELGLHAKSNKLIIVCPSGFWRLGNIKIVAEKYGIPLYSCLKDGIDALKKEISH